MRHTLMLHAVARGHMADFAPQYARHFSFRIEISENAADNLDVAARSGECIDFQVIDNGELVFDIAAMTLASQTLT